MLIVDLKADRVRQDEEMKERRKAQTRELLVETIQRERVDDEQKADEEDGESSESEADVGEEDEEALLPSAFVVFLLLLNGGTQAEFEKWKIRELKRIRRDQEEKLQWEKEQQEIERRRFAPLRLPRVPSLCG